MAKTSSRLEYLFERYFQGTCTQEEKNELLGFVGQAQYDEELRRLMDQVWTRLSTAYHLNDAQSERILSEILSSPSSGQKFPEKRRKTAILKWGAAAAVLLVLLATGGLWYYHSIGYRTAGTDLTVQSSEEKISHGGQKAVLTLANGKSIVLDSMHNGVVAHQGGLPVIKLSGRLSYALPGNMTAVPVYNTITTPRGGIYEIILPDSSRVWLNAMSSLRFPTAFTEDERKVELTGEAYFEITPDERRPFKVTVNDMKVDVLGTRFDIMAYDDAPAMKTTLLEGSVKVSGSDDQVILKPGQAALLHPGRHAGLKVTGADMQEAVAWKNGLFLFRNSDLRTVLQEIARWYDIEVVYQGEVHTRLNGMISRNTDLLQVLHMLEVTSDIGFGIRGRQIIVKPADRKKMQQK